MAVHAHPDDECLLTGGMLARYAAEGHRTVLVTCTDGAVGEIHAETNGRPLAEVRAEELAAACDALGVRRQVFLGYRDSGMAGTDDNAHPDAFAAAKIESAADRLLALFEEERPDIVVTYDERGGYGHPDHVRAHDVTLDAWRRSTDAAFAPRKLYLASVPRSAIEMFTQGLREAGLEPPGGDGDAESQDEEERFEFGVADERFTTFLDVTAYYDAKRAAIECHRTQIPADSWWKQMPEEMARLVFSTEFFILADARITTSVPESDLLAGLP
jgi:N-acetyl-1-D-myo-inositol-2-amino-2-deoxy-alpha-D-glucopyranoside deacetylase